MSSRLQKSVHFLDCPFPLGDVLDDGNADDHVKTRRLHRSIASVGDDVPWWRARIECSLDSLKHSLEMNAILCIVIQVRQGKTVVQQPDRKKSNCGANIECPQIPSLEA